MADLLSNVGLFDTRTDYAVLPGINLRNENADTCQANACLCLHIFILLYANIIPKATGTVKEITGGYAGGESVTLLTKKMLWHNGFLTCFLRGDENIPECQKRASKALHSRILNPIFLQSEVVIPEMQNGEKYVLRCNGFMAPKCVTRIAVAVFLVCAKIIKK